MSDEPTDRQDHPAVRKYHFGHELGPFVPEYDETLVQRVMERKRREWNKYTVRVLFFKFDVWIKKT